MSDQKQEKAILDKDVAERMREAGIPKPPEVYGSSFLETSDAKMQSIVYLATKGLSAAEIAESVHMTAHRVAELLKTERVQFEMKALNYKLHGVDAQKRFKEILPHAIEALEKVIMDPDTKAAVKANAATYMIDRVLGRPKQSIEVEGNLIREMLEKLQQAKTVDVSFSEVPSAVKEETAIVFRERPQDPIDAWAQANLK